MPLPAGFRPAHILNTYVCSGHGKWDPSYGRFVTPSNVTLLFWVHHGEALVNGTEIENLILVVKDEKVTRPDKSYNMNPRKLTTPEKLASFEAYADNRRMDVPPRPRFGLPEVIPPFHECYNYELSYDPKFAMYVNMSKITLMQDFENYPGDNVIQCSSGQPKRMLAEIIDSIATNPAENIQVHWAACRAIESMIPA